MAKKKIFPLAVIAVAVGAFAYALRTDSPEEPPADDVTGQIETAEPVQKADEEKPEAPAEESAKEPEATVPPEEPKKDDGKVKLPGERAEEERQEAARKAQEPPAPPKEEPKQRLFKVKVKDAATIESGDMTVALAGVKARDPTDKCHALDGREWPCGAVARGALMRLIRGRAVECEMPPAEQSEAGAICKVGGTDLSAWVLKNGWAEPADGVDENLRKAHAEAKENNLGLYRDAAPQISLTP